MFMAAVHRVMVIVILAAALIACAPAASSQQSAPAACTNAAGDSRFGVNDPLGWTFLYTPETMAHAFQMMRDAGIGWVRLNFAWKDMQPQPGAFDYSHYDLIASLAQQYHVRILPILFAIPAWDSTAPEALKAEKGNLSPVDRYRPATLDNWLTYVRNMVERYDGDGVDDAADSPRMDYWEVWNEENLAQFWPPAPDIQEYVNLLSATYTAIHQADPTAKVVLGGMSGNGVNSDNTGYLQQVYALGGAANFDVVSVHLYTHPQADAVSRIQSALAATRAVMDANGDQAKPLWLTEIGWSDTPDAWGQPTASPQEIADFLTQVYSTPMAADAIFWYNFRNIFDNSPDVEHNFGIIHADFTLKPAYQAYAAIAAGCIGPNMP
jgi:polysaccharide biosynthesis protein PslG